MYKNIKYKTVDNKNIDIVVRYFYPVAAGIETNILETYSRMVEKGWKVTIHTSKDNYLEKNTFPEYENIRNLEVRRYKYGLFGFKPSIDWNTTNLVCLHNFDIFTHFQIFLKILLLKIQGKKSFLLIVTPHGGFNPEWRIYNPLIGNIKRIYHYTLGVLFLNLLADGIRTVSEWETIVMVKKGVKKYIIRTIENGIEDEAYETSDDKVNSEFKRTVRSWGKYLLQIGRIYPIKNYETTIRALKFIPQDINFVIVGPISDKYYFNDLKKLAKSLNVEKRLIFAGVFRSFEKYYLIKNAQMMVHMAIWESFCNVVHEGLSQGLVCIVADNTALPYLIKNNINGYCISTYNYKLLAEKINYILNNKNENNIKNIEINNKTYGLKNSWRLTTDRVDLFYSNLLFKFNNKFLWQKINRT